MSDYVCVSDYEYVNICICHCMCVCVQDGNCLYFEAKQAQTIWRRLSTRDGSVTFPNTTRVINTDLHNCARASLATESLLLM